MTKMAHMTSGTGYSRWMARVILPLLTFLLVVCVLHLARHGGYPTLLPWYHCASRYPELANKCGMENTEQYSEGYRDLGNADFLGYIRCRWVIAPTLCPVSLHDEKAAASGLMSQAGQSLFVDQLLNHRRNGFFIESGAASGEELSNTIFFELSRNWTGLLIEPEPRFYKGIVQKNRNALFMNVAIGFENKTSVLKFKKLGVLAGISDTLSDGIQDLKKKDDEILVQSLPMASILLALGVKKVDYFSLDVEGPELEILKTLPYDRVYFDVLSIEYAVLNKNIKPNFDETLKKLADIRRFFHKRGTHREVGILYPPQEPPLPAREDKYGLDVVFQHI